MVLGPQHVLVKDLLTLPEPINLVQQFTDSPIAHVLACDHVALPPAVLLDHGASQPVDLVIDLLQHVIPKVLALHPQNFADLPCQGLEVFGLR